MIAEQDMDRTLAVLKIVWMALLGSLALYLLAGSLSAPGLTPRLGEEALGRLRIALYALAFVTLIGARYVRRLILAAGGPSAGPASVLQKYSSAVIASLAMSESVGIYGLVLSLLGKNAPDLYLLAGISAAALHYFRPRKDELLSLCQRGA